MISIVIPAYNESGAIVNTISSLLNLKNIDEFEHCELIVVDDGSEDNTAELARKSGATVISHPHNIGYGRSLKSGILSAKCETIVIVDADLTYPIESIPTLLQVYKEGRFDMVVGARTGPEYKGSFLKFPMRLFLKLLVEFTAGRSIPDINSGLRIFDKETIKTYLNHLCDTFSFTTSMTLAYMMTGRFVKFIDIEYRPRVGTTKVKLLKDSLRTLQYVTQAIIYYNPLKLFFLISLILIIAGCSLFLSAYMSEIAVFYFLGIGCVLLSVLVFCIGLLADLLRQILAK